MMTTTRGRAGLLVMMLVIGTLGTATRAAAQAPDNPYTTPSAGPRWCAYNPYVHGDVMPTQYDARWCSPLDDIHATAKDKVSIPEGAIGVPGQEMGFLILQPTGRKAQQIFVEFQFADAPPIRHVFELLPSMRGSYNLRAMLPPGTHAFSTLVLCQDTCDASLALHVDDRLWWGGRPTIIP